MLKREKSPLPTGLMSLCFLLAFSALRPTELLEERALLSCTPTEQEAVLYLFHTCWIDPSLVLGSEISGWVISNSYLCPGTQPSCSLIFFFFPFPSGFFLYFHSWQKFAIVGRPPCKSTYVQAWQQAVADFWLQALFKILMPSVWYCESGQFACNCKASHEICSNCCPCNSYNVPEREMMSS